jgi:hypothetical protein
MQRERTHLDEPEREHEPAPAPPVVQSDRLAWASAVGNQAVQALARAAAPAEEELAPEEEAAPEEAAVEGEAAEAAGPEGELEAAAIPDELPEDELPE